MEQIGITYEELVEIYERAGHTIKQPNSVKAIAGALNIVATRVYQSLDERLVQLATAVMELATKVGVMSRSAGSSKPTTYARGTCYCGMPITGPQCETCKRIHANH